MSQDQSWKRRILIAGGIIGALLGLSAAFLYVRVAEEGDGPKKVSTGEAVKLAIAALGVVRQVSQLGR